MQAREYGSGSGPSRLENPNLQRIIASTRGPTDLRKTQNQFENLLTARSRSELRSRVGGSGFKVTLPQAQELVAHARPLEPAVHTLRLRIVHPYPTDRLAPAPDLGAALHARGLDAYPAP